MPKLEHKNVRQECRDRKGKSILGLLRKISLAVSVFLMLMVSVKVEAATETFTTGAFIINMGVTPQTVANGLKPYGMIYDLIKNYDVPIKWVIGQG